MIKSSIQTRLVGCFFLIFIIFIVLNYFQYENFSLGVNKIPAEMMFLLSSAIFSVSLGMLVFIMDISIVSPLAKLKKAVYDIRMGNLHTTIDIKSNDEIGQLAEALNEIIIDMTRFREKTEKLENQNKDMDKLIYSKTKELNDKIEDLTKMKTAILNMMEDTDDTNIKLLVSQEKLKKSVEELKELDVRKDQFISVAAHELKTPITAIRGFSDLLHSEKIANDVNARNRYLNIINSEIKRLGRLIDDILDLSRIDIGKIRLTTEDVDIYEVMERVKGMTSINIREKGLDYNFDIQKDLPHIMNDKERLEQILLNLVNNATKFTDTGSITISAYKENYNIHFAIKDTGIGIPKKDLEKIGERFYQVESHLTRKAGGAGLGLSICKEILKIMNGRLLIESEVDKGSTFHVILPISPG